MIVIVAQFQSPIGLAARSPALRQPLLRRAARPAFHKAADKPAPPAGPQPSARTTRQLPQRVKALQTMAPGVLPFGLGGCRVFPPSAPKIRPDPDWPHSPGPHAACTPPPPTQKSRRVGNRV